ncbi:hypothetical protein [Nocardioides sp. AE5]|uniref:hypothetical protein n=1 Tax=Nocardioides sp. AE5 TaxID=2962573 RepID=UPI002881EC21|nr:hypothetical protein [Nocardioides sp. AE5]MDT0203720.1 hypothetical protein [Nocardioides sp. AE5]
MTSTSREQDLGYLALRDVAAVRRQLEDGYRIVGGNAVSLLAAAFEVVGVPERDTADADVAADFEVLANPELLERMAALGYTRDDGSRLSRPLSESERRGYHGGGASEVPAEVAALRATVDFMGPSLSGRHEPNQEAGDLHVDAFPGVSLALAQPAVLVSFNVRLTTGSTFRVSVPLPSPQSALCLKLLAYRDRLAQKDAVDVWRLLGVCREAGLRPGDWRNSGSQGDALTVLWDFVKVGGFGLKSMTPDVRAHATVRALALAVAPARSLG